MIGVKLTIPQSVEDLFDGFSGDEIEDILLDASVGFCGPGGVLEKHWQHGQGSWGEPDDDYQDMKERRYGSSEKFVKSGAAKEAITAGKSPYLKKVISKTTNGFRIEVALVRMEGGRNIYSIAQAGGRNNSGPPMRITDNLPGDDEIIAPYIEASLKIALSRKGLL